MGIEKIIFIYPTYETTRLTVEDTLQFVPLGGVYARQNYARMPIGDLTRKVVDYIRGTGAAHTVLTMDQGPSGRDDLWGGDEVFSRPDGGEGIFQTDLHTMAINNPVGLL